MKVLMYGWEFPPQISGGLGVACHAMITELAKQKVYVNAVLPFSVSNDIDEKYVNFYNCDNVIEDIIAQEQAKISAIEANEHLQENFYAKTSTYSKNSNISHELLINSWEELKQATLGRYLNPYLNAEQEQFLLNKQQTKFKQDENICENEKVLNLLRNLERIATISPKQLLIELFSIKNVTRASNAKLTGKYGFNLLDEVYQYALIAGSLASKIDHDVIHVHDWLTVLAGVVAKKRCGKPLVFHAHALEPDRSGQSFDTRIYAIEQYGMMQADKVIAVSNYTKQTIIKYYGIDANKIEVVYNGTYANNAMLRPISKKNHKMILFLGRLAHQKGPMYFIETARKILEYRQDVHFVIAGNGGMYHEMMHKVASLGLGRYIHFTGFLNHANIDKVFRLADVYVMPSISEPFGLSCLEAISYGVPVVISKQSGVAEVLPNAIKVDFWDTQEMANKILALLEYKALRKDTLQHSVSALQQLTWELNAEKLLQVYQQAINLKN